MLSRESQTRKLKVLSYNIKNMPVKFSANEIYVAANLYVFVENQVYFYENYAAKIKVKNNFFQMSTYHEFKSTKNIY